MRVSAFSGSDVLFNVHGYSWYDGGRTSGDMEELARNFPGKVFGVSERGRSKRLYGFDFMPDGNVLKTKNESGDFPERNLGIEYAEYLVLGGGQLGSCHLTAYQNLIDNELSADTEVILPAKQCFGHLPHLRLDISEPTYTLHDFLEGNLPEISSKISSNDYTVEQLAMSASDWGKYDWSRTSIRPIEF